MGWSLGVQEVLVCTHAVGTERVRAVVLVDHPIVIDPEMLRALAAERVESLQVNRVAWTRNFVEELLNPAPSDEYLEALTQAALATPTNAAAMMMANLYLVGPTGLRPALDALDRPALFVYSSLDWATASAEQVRKGWPEIHVKVIDDTPHALFVVKPQEFNFVLEEFLASLPRQ